MYLNKRQLITYYNKGYLDEVAKQLRRYGEILEYKDFTIEDGYHAGAHRIMRIKHHSIMWDLNLHNGEVKSLGYTL